MLDHVLGQDYVRENAYTGELWEIPAAKWEKILSTEGFPHSSYNSLLHLAKSDH